VKHTGGECEIFNILIVSGSESVNNVFKLLQLLGTSLDPIVRLPSPDPPGYCPQIKIPGADTANRQTDRQTDKRQDRGDYFYRLVETMMSIKPFCHRIIFCAREVHSLLIIVCMHPITMN